MSITKSSAAYSEIRVCLKPLLEGTVLSIDPSIGSSSSMPGWAVYRAGELQASGTIEINPDGTQWERLQHLARRMKQLMIEWSPDVLVYEKPTDVPFKGMPHGAARSLASIHKAVGAILSVPGPARYVGIMPTSWKKLVREGYTKSDENDAIEIGWVVIQQAQEISSKDPPRTYGQRKRKRSRPVPSLRVP